MASDSQTDDAATHGVRRAVGPLISGLWRAVFGVCAVAVGALTLLLAAGTNTGDSTAVFAILGIAAVLVGLGTISRLPKPNPESARSDRPTDTDEPKRD